MEFIFIFHATSIHRHRHNSFRSLFFDNLVGYSLRLLSPNAPASSTQTNWANRAKFNSTTRAHFSELLAAQRVKCRVFGILKSRVARKRGQKIDIQLLAPQRLAANREK
jgi:hypothetical protein